MTMLTGTIDEVAGQAERILHSVAPTALVATQEWDNRIDCLIWLPNGQVVGEMILLSTATESRVKEAGIRLQQRLNGIAIPLQNELWPPIQIAPSSPQNKP